MPKGKSSRSKLPVIPNPPGKVGRPRVDVMADVRMICAEMRTKRLDWPESAALLGIDGRTIRRRIAEEPDGEIVRMFRDANLATYAWVRNKLMQKVQDGDMEAIRLFLSRMGRKVDASWTERHEIAPVEAQAPAPKLEAYIPDNGRGDVETPEEAKFRETG